MDDPLLVGVAHHLGELADEIDPGGERELPIPLGEEVVEPDGGGIMLEDDGRPEFVAGVLHGPEDARALQVFDELELADGGPLVRSPDLLGGIGADRVDADPPLRVGELDVAALPVLEAAAFVNLLLEQIVAHPPLPIGLPNTGLLDRPGDEFGSGAVELGSTRQAFEPGALAAADRRHDAGASRSAVGGVAVPQADLEAARAGEVALEVWGRQEDERLNEGDSAAPLGRALVVKQVGELFGFEVGELERVVGGCKPAVGLPRPGAGIAADPARPALDLDEKESVGGEDEQIDLVDRAVDGDELEERPGPVGLVLGKSLADEVERVTLPRVGRLGEARPV